MKFNTFLKFIGILSFLSFSNYSFGQNTVSPTVIEIKSGSTMQYLIDASPEFTEFLKGLNASKLNRIVDGGAELTIFAPQNSAFKIKQSDYEELLKPQNLFNLEKLLSYHIIAGRQGVDHLKDLIRKNGGSYEVLSVGQGGKLIFSFDESGNVLLEDASGVKTPIGNPIIRSNGLVYSIDRLLVPFNMK